MELTEYIDNEISKTSGKTKDYDKLGRKMIKDKIDVSSLADIVLEKQQYHRIFFQVSLGLMDNYIDQFAFVEKHADKLADWWHVDNLLQFVDSNGNFEYVFKLAKKYVKSKNLFLRRWGYVLFLLGYHKEEKYFDKIVSLLKDDDDYYVVMAEAWLISFLAIYNIEKTYDFLSKSKIKYNILGKAIQKICDSFRISDENKERFKALRIKLKEN